MAYLNIVDRDVYFAGDGTFHLDFIYIANDIYIVAFRSVVSGSYVASVRISAVGVMTVLDTLQYSVPYVDYPLKALPISGNVFAVFGYDTTDACIDTFSVDLVTGVLTAIDHDVFDTFCNVLSVVHINGTVYAICYQGPGSDGWLKTWDIANNGVIGAQVDQWEWNPASGECEDLYHIPGTLIYIAISGSNVFTFQIANTGVITAAIIDTFALSNCEHPRMAHVSGLIYAFAYRNTVTNRLQVDTLEIDNAGNIAAALTDTWNYFDNGHDASIIRMTYYPTVFFILYTGFSAPSHYARGLQLEIDNAGGIGVVLPAYDTSTSIVFGETNDFAGCKSMVPIVGSNLIATACRASIGGLAGRLASFGFQPIVTTQPVTSPIVGHGTVTDLGEPVLTQHGFVWSNAPNPTYYPGSAWQVELGPGGLGAFSAVIPTTGLIAGDTYHIRAYAFNACEIGGIVYGSNVAYGVDETFIAQWVPTVITDPATSIVDNSASINGTLSNDGGEACVCGFEWGLTPTYGNTTPTQSRTTGLTFAQTVDPLNPSTTYYFRAFATNSIGTSYGAQRSFTTLQVPYYASLILPSVQTNPATLVTEHTARLNGIVIEDGGAMGDTRFQWGLTTNYGNITPWQQGFAKGDTFFVDLNNLAEGTAFHFRAQMRNQGGVVSGNDMAFNTLSPLGPVTLIDDELIYLLEAV